MPALDVLDSSNNKVGSVDVLANVFEGKVNEGLVQRYVAMQSASRRGGNAATIQNKGGLHGSNAKPWRQKGTGRARFSFPKNQRNWRSLLFWLISLMLRASR